MTATAFVYIMSTVLAPSEVVAGIGGIAIFTCRSKSSALTDVEWLINGTSLQELNDVRQVFEPISEVGIIRFDNLPVEYNNTVLQCIPIASSGSQMASRNSTLLVQGNVI